MSGKVAHLVLDSGAFIRGSHLQDVGDKFYTIREVVEEIKDKEARKRISCLPFELTFMEPDPQDIKFVIDFSKKTGDFSSMSVVDIKVLALTCQLQRMYVNRDHENREPSRGQIVASSGKNGGQIIGFTPFSRGKEPGDDEGWITPDNLADFITKVKGLNVDGQREEEVPLVACMTVDFAMQNVLLQLGLKLLSVDDTRVLKKLNHFVLRCHACYKVTEDMSRKFCPSCGNLNTLKRVSCSVNEKGEKEIFINFKRPIRVRGTKYAIPHPRGGQHANNPILVEDQPVPHNRPHSSVIKEKKLMTEAVLDDPAYLLRSNPFAKRDVYSRASRFRTPTANSSLIPEPFHESKKSATGNRRKK